MKFNARGGISILELFIYFPSIIAAVFICSRHGFNRSSGWIFTLILCLIRIIGACCQLATYHDQSQGLLEAALILDFVGLSPLLLATLGLLSRWYVRNLEGWWASGGFIPDVHSVSIPSINIPLSSFMRCTSVPFNSSSPLA